MPAHDVINPATGQVVRTAGLAGAGRADAAIARAAADAKNLFIATDI